MEGDDTKNIIRISLGPLANTVSSHLCNLETLAIANDDEEGRSGPILNPFITHSHRGGTLVPRALFVDQKQELAFNNNNSMEDIIPWGGAVDSYEQIGAINPLDDADFFRTFREQAGYALTGALNRNPNRPTKKRSAKSSDENESRHMNWDDLGSEKEDEDEEEAERRRQEKERMDYQNQRALEQSAESAWMECPIPKHWRDYVILPPHVTTDHMMLPLPNIYPHSHEETKSSFLSGWKLEEGSSYGRKFRDDILGDSIRNLLEESDYVGGFQVLIDFSSAFYSGLCTSVLEEIGDECKGVGRWSIGVGNSNIPDDSTNSINSSGMYSQIRREERQKFFRRDLNYGLSMHGVMENSDLLLPIDLAHCAKALNRKNEHSIDSFHSNFLGGAGAALALETSTLQYRLSGNSNNGQIAMAGCGMSYFADDYITKNRMGFHDFISSLLPANRYSLVELNARISSLDNISLYETLEKGTSLGEQRRMRNDPRGARRDPRVKPGDWLAGEDLVSSLSFSHGQSNDRSLHSHFGLSSSIRTPCHPRIENPVHSCTASLMESAARYRSERRLACVVDSSIDKAIKGGSYWVNSIFPGSEQQDPSRMKNTSILSVLENSTRSHSFIKDKSTKFSRCLSRSMKGFFVRDNSAGLLPDEEECYESLECLKNLDETYNPGLDVEDEEYYDGNED